MKPISPSTRSATRTIDFELADRDTSGAATWGAVEPDAVAGDGGEIEAVGFIVDAIIGKRIVRDDAEAVDARPDAVLADLDSEGRNPTAIAEVDAFLEDDAG